MGLGVDMALKSFAAPVLPLPPAEYSAQYLNQIVRTLNQYFQQLGSTNPIEVDSILLRNLPTSATGLPVGSVWNDTGTLKIVI
jgi:hypothetical protein